VLTGGRVAAVWPMANALAHGGTVAEPGARGWLVAAVMLLISLAMAAVHLAALRCPDYRAKLAARDRGVRPATTRAEGMEVKVHHGPKCGTSSESEYRTPPASATGGCC